MVGTMVQPDYETQGPTVYKTNIDNAIAVLSAWGASFAPHEQSTPDMTIQLDAGTLFDGTDLIVLAAQNTGTITAPATNPRKDIVYIDPTGGGGSPLVYIGVQTGSEAASPADPTLSAGLIPIARINLTTSTTAIANTDIDDLRGVIWDQGAGGGYSDPLTTRGDIVVRGASATQRLAKGAEGTVLVAGADDPAWGQVDTPGIADGAVTAEKLATFYECHDITHTADTALATQAAGGSQLGATLSDLTIPASGVIRLTIISAEIDETESSANAAAAFALSVGGTKVWGTLDDANGGANFGPVMVANSGASSVLFSQNTPGTAGSNLLGFTQTLVMTFDIAASGFPTGTRDVALFSGDNVQSLTGEITVTGTTTTFRAMVEIIGYT